MPKLRLPKIHPRETIVQKADTEIGAAISKIWEKYDLTYGEMVKILSGELAHAAKWMIRRERHPDDTDKPGGLE